MPLLLLLAACGLFGGASTSEDTADFGILFKAPERHVVAKGETLGTIAKQYDVTVADLLDWNYGVDADRIEVGQELLVWRGKAKTAKAGKKKARPKAAPAAFVMDDTRVARGPAPELRRAGVLGALDADATVAARLADGDVDELAGSVDRLRGTSAHGIGAAGSTGIRTSASYDDGRWVLPDGAADPFADDAPGASAAPRVAAPKLALPAAKACLGGPTGDGLGDDGMAASAGLSFAQVQKVTRAFLPKTASCASGSGTVRTEITVGCDGRVSYVDVLGSDGLSAESVSCVEQTLRYMGFPAHDLPDGFTFELPISFY